MLINNLSASVHCMNNLLQYREKVSRTSYHVKEMNAQRRVDFCTPKVYKEKNNAGWPLLNGDNKGLYLKCRLL